MTYHPPSRETTQEKSFVENGNGVSMVAKKPAKKSAAKKPVAKKSTAKKPAAKSMNSVAEIEARAAKKPFFLYLAHNAPHFPLQAPAEEIAKFRGKYLAGWGELRNQRYARQLELGLLDPSWKLSPRPDAIKAWSTYTDEEKARFDHIMSVYAATITLMDKAIPHCVQR